MMNKNIIAGGIGTLLEWAEFTFYAYLIVKLSQLFFSNFSTSFALMMGFGTFAVSYLARPLGGIVFGYIGDKKGRKVALTGSILLMAVSTLFIGLLPTYATIGMFASISLIILRFIQGLAVAGEFTGAAIFLAEHDHNKTYLASSWISTFSALGMLIGITAAIIVSLDSMPAWAWRIPFILFGLLAMSFGFLVRLKAVETQTFQVIIHNQEQQSLFSLLKKYKLSMLKTASIAAFVGIYIYTCNVWWLSYVAERHYISDMNAHMLVIFSQAMVVVLIPVVAILADKIGGRILMSLGLIGASITAFTLFNLTPEADLKTIAQIQVCYALCNAAVTATMFKYLVSIFPAQIRSTGQALSWNVAVAIFGGTAPLVAQALTSSLSVAYAPALYVMLSAFVALIINNLWLFKIKRKFILSL